MENQSPISSANLHGISRGIMLVALSVLLIIPFTTFVPVLDPDGDADWTKYILPILQGAGALMILGYAFLRQSGAGETAKFAYNLLGIGALCVLASVAMTLGEVEADEDTPWISLMLFGIAGVCMAIAYARMSEDLELQGAGLTSKCLWAIVGCMVVLILVTHISKDIKAPEYDYENADRYEDAVKAFRRQLNLIQTFSTSAMIGVLGGLFGAMFGSRITAESAEMIEQSNPEYRELADSTTDTPSTPSN